jgi:hypothetical protein
VQAKPVESTTTATVSNDNKNGDEAAALHALRFRPSFWGTRRYDNTCRRGDSHHYRHSTSSHSEQEFCWRCCGNHNQENCWCRDRHCYSCGDFGHLSRMCHKARQMSCKTSSSKDKQKPCKYGKNCKVHYTANNGSPESTDSDSESSENAINVVCSKHKCESDILICCLVGVEISMQVDTCADVSIIPNQILLDKFPDIILHRINDTLSTHGGIKMNILGKILVSVEYDKQVFHNLPFMVIDADKKQPILFGKNWIRLVEIDVTKFFSVNSAKNNVVKKSEYKSGDKIKSHKSIHNTDLQIELVDQSKTEFSVNVSKESELNSEWSNVSQNFKIPHPKISLQNGEKFFIKRKMSSNKIGSGIVECRVSNFVYSILIGHKSKLYHIDFIQKAADFGVKGEGKVS